MFLAHMINRRRAILVVATVLAALSREIRRRRPPSSAEGLLLLHKVQDALGGAKRLAAVRDFEETIRAQAWDASGTSLGDVRKRIGWMKSPNLVRLIREVHGALTSCISRAARIPVGRYFRI